MKNRNNCCPKCKSNLLARCDNKIFCLSSSCDWSIEPKREEDKEIPEIHNLEYLWS
jgi:hypothetical protein